MWDKCIQCLTHKEHLAVAYICRSVRQYKVSTQKCLLSAQICGKQDSQCSVSWEEESRTYESWEGKKGLLSTAFGSMAFWCVSVWFALLCHPSRVKRKCGRSKRPCRKSPLTSFLDSSTVVWCPKIRAIEPGAGVQQRSTVHVIFQDAICMSLCVCLMIDWLSYAVPTAIFGDC